MTCVLTAERGGDIIFPSDRRWGGIETDDPTFKSLNWDWTEKLRVMDTTNILLDILLFVKDIKSNNNIFDRNREYMTRNRWLNKQRLPSPRYGLRYWCSRRNGQGTRTQVLLGEVQIVKHLSTRSCNQIDLICKPSSVHTEWIFMNSLSKFCST